MQSLQYKAEYLSPCFKASLLREFPNAPVVRTLETLCSYRVSSLLRELKSHTSCGQKIKTKKRKSKSSHHPLDKILTQHILQDSCGIDTTIIPIL